MCCCDSIYSSKSVKPNECSSSHELSNNASILNFFPQKSTWILLGSVQNPLHSTFSKTQKTSAPLLYPLLFAQYQLVRICQSIPEVVLSEVTWFKSSIPSQMKGNMALTDCCVICYNKYSGGWFGFRYQKV